jgi:predicted nucleotidyltransferase
MIERATKPQLEFLEVLLNDLTGDPRVRALWLKGSMGRGRADRHSDIDLQIALLPEDAVSFHADYEARLNQIASVILHHELFGGSMIGTKLLNAKGKLISLHSFLETGTALQIIETQTRVLYDPHGVLEILPASIPNREDIARALQVEICYFWNLLSDLPSSIERGETITALQYLHHEANQIIFVSSLGRGRPRDVGDLHLNDLLEQQERQRLERALTLPDISPASIVNAHFDLAKQMWHTGRHATKNWSTDYPAQFERAMLEHVTRELKRLGLWDSAYGTELLK